MAASGGNPRTCRAPGGGLYGSADVQDRPLESPLVFYPRRVAGMLSAGVRWGSLAIRLRRLRKRIEHDPLGRSYVDEALQATDPNKLDHFVEVFADKIPKTHGAPVQAALSG